MATNAFCPNCGAEIQAMGDYCHNCGKKITWRCIVCGSRNLPTTRFCPTCGRSIDHHNALPGGLTVARANQWSKQFNELGMVREDMKPLLMNLIEGFLRPLDYFNILPQERVLFCCLCGNNRIKWCRLNNEAQTAMFATRWFMGFFKAAGLFSKGKMTYKFIPYDDLVDGEVHNDEVIINTTQGDRIHVKYDLPSAGFLTVAALFSDNIAHQLVAHHRIEVTQQEQVEFMRIISRFWEEVVGKDPNHYVNPDE